MDSVVLFALLDIEVVKFRDSKTESQNMRPTLDLMEGCVRTRNRVTKHDEKFLKERVLLQV